MADTEHKVGAASREQAVERVARAMWHREAMRYADVPLEDWDLIDQPHAKEDWRRLADAAIDAHLEAYYTSYVDEEHQGGNLLELFMHVVAALSRRDNELQRTREELNVVSEEFARLQADHTRASTSLAEARQELGRRLRQGQTAMIMLALLRPDLEVLVQHTDADAFHDDARLPALMDWVRERMRRAQTDAPGFACPACNGAELLRHTCSKRAGATDAE